MSSGKRLTPSDAMFLYGESRETMMHVAGMMPFSPPPDAPPDYLRGLMDEIRAGVPVHRPFNLRLRTPELLRNPLQTWVEDDAVDLDYHVRRSALPSPGDERELGILVSRLHGHPVDFHYPPWELHLIEGLEGGRFAMYVKVHHSLIDGFTAMRLLSNALSTDPHERDRPLFFSIPPRMRPARDGAGEGAHVSELLAAVRAQYGAAKTAVRAIKKLIDSKRSGDHDFVTPRQAPKSLLNARISKSRRFATQRIETARLKAVAKASGG
ncbi:MAG: wax ester/triacylglycerol synthase family O-acyltransferase, partial [Kofleriaceae bacterium]